MARNLLSKYEVDGECAIDNQETSFMNINASAIAVQKMDESNEQNENEMIAAIDITLQQMKSMSNAPD